MKLSTFACCEVPREIELPRVWRRVAASIISTRYFGRLLRCRRPVSRVCCGRGPGRGQGPSRGRRAGGETTSDRLRVADSIAPRTPHAQRACIPPRGHPCARPVRRHVREYAGGQAAADSQPSRAGRHGLHPGADRRPDSALVQARCACCGDRRGAGEGVRRARQAFEQGIPCPPRAPDVDQGGHRPPARAPGQVRGHVPRGH
mmetsp:Transcript_22045/g.74143  ORF Transcript_22045/g.74143 Transcript_22045/m.74143 type:complete len:203 (-) Transcript_22045:2257-2865(-)